MVPPVGSALPPSNPFATRFVCPGSIEYRFCLGGTWTRSPEQARQLAARLDQVRSGLIVGPHGSGKTTLLHSLRGWLAEKFVESKHLQLQAPPSRGVLARLHHARATARLVFCQQSQLREGGLMVVDGAEQLGPLVRARLLRRIRRRRQAILATSHVPLRGMSVLHQTEISRDLVHLLTRSLVADASAELVEFVARQLSERDLSKLTNLRQFWFELYDQVQDRLQQKL